MCWFVFDSGCLTGGFVVGQGVVDETHTPSAGQDGKKVSKVEQDENPEAVAEQQQTYLKPALVLSICLIIKPASSSTSSQHHLSRPLRLRSSAFQPWLHEQSPLQLPCSALPLQAQSILPTPSWRGDRARPAALPTSMARSSSQMLAFTPR